jgi:hypothetical protein
MDGADHSFFAATSFITITLGHLEQVMLAL